MVSQLAVNAVSAVVLFVVATGGALVPSCLWRRDKSQNGPGLLFQLGNILSAGVMLSAGLCHLLPDAISEIQPSFNVEDCTKVRIKDFPMGTFLCGLGLVVTLIIDQIAEAATSGYGIGHNHSHSHSHSHSRSHSHSHSHSHHHGSLPIIGGIKEELEEDYSHLMHKSNSLPLHVTVSTSSTEYHSLYGQQSMEIEYAKVDPPPTRVSVVTAILLSMALSLHSVLEGAALGAQTSVQAQRNIMIAILAHKGLSSYALGASLAGSELECKQFWTLVLGFSLASPFGIMSGFALSQVASGYITSSLSALASGTFLYVAVFEVIPKELETSGHKIVKLAALATGFGLMSTLAIWA